MRDYRTKRFSTVGGNYVNVRVYKTLKALKQAYKLACKGNNVYVDDIIGVHCAYKRIDFKPGEKWGNLMNETGTVYLCKQYSKCHIVAHEFFHALLWSHKHTYEKENHPVTIDDMDQEEDIAYGLTDMLQKFYKWLPTITF